MNALTLARIQALGRVAIGGALLAAPSNVASGWLGSASRRPATRTALAAVGARDLALGLGAAWALGGGERSRPWLLAGTLADAADLAATLKFRDDLPPLGVIGVGAMAGGSAALGLWLLSEVD